MTYVYIQMSDKHACVENAIEQKNNLMETEVY